MSAMIVVNTLKTHEEADWDAYVRASPDGLPHHLSAWRNVLRRTYDYDTPYLIARYPESQRVAGVLPLYLIRSALVGRFATSMQGGLCADNEEVAAALIEKGREVVREARLKRLVLQDTRRAWPGLETSCHHVHWVVSLESPDPEAIWKRLHRNVRREVRRGEEEGLVVDLDRTGRCLGDFYDVMSRFTHQMGTPVFGRNFVENVIDAFPNQFVIHVVRREQDPTPMGAYFSMILNDTLHGLWGATLREYLPLHASYVAYWEFLRDAAAHGFSVVDMGRSPEGSNASKFKGQWGGVSRPVCQQVLSIDGGSSAQAISSRVREDAQFRRFSQIWSRLPFAVHLFLGPKLRRHIPFG